MELPSYSTEDPKPQVNPAEAFDVTQWFEERNAALAFREIVKELQEYLSIRSNAQSPSKAFCADGYYWICIGDVSLSKSLKQNICEQFQASDGQHIQFKNWKQINDMYPEVSALRNLRGKAPSFVGLPLPQEEFKEESANEESA